MIALIGMLDYSTPVYAEWLLYGPTTKSGMTTYYSSESVKSVEEYETVMVLKNFSGTQTVQYDGGAYIYKSIINRQIIDCKNKRYATASVDMYAQLDGLGNKSSVYMKRLEWNPIKNNSIQEALTEQVCKII